MDSTMPITTMFLDIGGVLLTNGWDRHARKLAANTFHFNFDEMDERHHLTFDTYEQGKLTLDEYLERVVFHEPRTFLPEEFRNFMFSRSQPHEDMIELIRELKTRYRLKTVAVSNEGRELTVYRIEQFRLQDIIDFFISSCFVHSRKPDEDIYRIALDISQSAPGQVVYIDDRPMFVEIANGLGLHGIRHTDYLSTKTALAGFGLTIE